MSDDFDGYHEPRPPRVEQPELFAAPEVSEHRVEALANYLAGLRWPGRGSISGLKVAQKTAVHDAAREALLRLAREAD